MDTISKDKRSWIMAQVKSKDTKAERIVRSLLHRLGYRFRLHRIDLPGNPDIILPKFHTAIFVHGCFWHRHSGCNRARMPSSNIEYWQRKFKSNVSRDEENKKLLESSGWQVIVIWECELKNLQNLESKLIHFLPIL